MGMGPLYCKEPWEFGKDIIAQGREEDHKVKCSKVKHRLIVKINERARIRQSFEGRSSWVVS